LESAVSVEELRDCLKEKIDQTLREVDSLFEEPQLLDNSSDEYKEKTENDTEIDLD
ncbi:TPA: hypothetical protein P7N87_003570, partial [Escherichia coli]|nr:hypothetical protein [Escherichia coli]